MFVVIRYVMLTRFGVCMIPVEIGVPDQDFQWSNTRAPFRNNKVTGYYSI